MGRWKDELIEQQESDRDAKLAAHLGITPEEFEEAGGEIRPDTGNDDVVYDYLVYFNSDAPEEILNKIDGLDKNGKYVSLGLNFFESEPEDHTTGE